MQSLEPELAGKKLAAAPLLRCHTRGRDNAAKRVGCTRATRTPAARCRAAARAPQELPLDFGALAALTALALRGNPLRPPFNRVLEAHGELAIVASLLNPLAPRLDLSECGFDRLPAEVTMLPRGGALRELVLTNNRLTDLPQVWEAAGRERWEPVLQGAHTLPTCRAACRPQWRGAGPAHRVYSAPRTLLSLRAATTTCLRIATCVAPKSLPPLQGVLQLSALTALILDHNFLRFVPAGAPRSHKQQEPLAGSQPPSGGCHCGRAVGRAPLSGPGNPFRPPGSHPPWASPPTLSHLALASCVQAAAAGGAQDEP